MQQTLFSTPKPYYQYGPDFEEAWRAYRGPKNQRKLDAHNAWRQVSATRPMQPVMLICIRLYREDIEKQKIAQQHFATFLRGPTWLGYLDDATYRFEHPAPAPKPREKPPYARPWTDEEIKPKRPWREILAERRDATK